MKWSKYNLLFKSEKYNYLLYNSLTNTFAEIDNAVYKELKKIQKSPETFTFNNNPGLYLQLVNTKVLVSEKEEAELLNLAKIKRDYSAFDDSYLELTIAPTLLCNFNCDYCYEEFRGPVHMNAKVENGIIDFMNRFDRLKFINITWFGGEPLLNFNRIITLTEKIKKLGIPFKATMVTNGYLLDKRKVSLLKGLKIKFIQVTIDGLEEIHNKRRPLSTGGKTFKKIISNVDNLLNNWKGQLGIRINIDHSNMGDYVKMHHYLSENFKGKKINIYPGITTYNEGFPDSSCQLNKKEEIDFIINLHKKHGISSQSFFPKPAVNGCVATIKNGFVVGPEGEIYNCLHDVGIKEMKVGSIFKGEPWNLKLLANYMVGTDPYNDKECVDCFYLPVCDGGCANMRLKNIFYDDNIPTCTKFKDRLPDFLEAYYEIKQKRQRTEPEKK